MRLHIASTGMYAPPRVETAAEIGARIHRSAEWVLSRTGVARRHIAEEPVEVLAAKAARAALGDGPPPDLLLNASTTPRQLIPDTSVFVARELGLNGVACHSVHGTCLSFFLALHTAAAFLNVGAYRRVLIVSAEISSTSRRYSEPESAALLGDGAAAAVVTLGPDPSAPEAAAPAGSAAPAGPAAPAGSAAPSALLGWSMVTFPEGAGLAEFPGAGTRIHPNSPEAKFEDHTFSMSGPRIYKFAVQRVGRIVAQALDQAGLSIGDIDLVVPHQVSGPGLAALRHYGIPAEKVVDIVAEYGNCIAASAPMALATAAADGRLRRGDRVLLVGTGAGLSIVAAVLRW